MKESEFLWDQPIIIIGAGRSGSTLLSCVIGEHPEVYTANETSFLLNRLWDTYFSKPEYVSFARLWRLAKNTQTDWKGMLWCEFRQKFFRNELKGLDSLFEKFEIAEEPRISLSLGRFMAESLVPPENRCRYWSFKEIWNGSAGFPYGWRRHDLAFPNARYIHIVRHPFFWARSYFLNMKVVPSVSDLLFAYEQWVAMNKMAQLQQVHRGRYIQLKLEDIKADHTASIGSLLPFLGLESHPNCFKAAQHQYLKGNGEVTLPVVTAQQIERVPGFLEMVDYFNYDASVLVG